MFDDDYDILNYTHNRIVTNLCSVGVSQEVAKMVAGEVVRGMSRDFGGTEPYIRTKPMTAAERAKGVMRAWNNGEHDVVRLAMNFGVTPRRIRQMVKR